MTRQTKDVASSENLFEQRVAAATRLFSREIERAAEKSARTTIPKVRTGFEILHHFGWGDRRTTELRNQQLLREWGHFIVDPLRSGVKSWSKGCQDLLRKHFRSVLEIAIQYADQLTDSPVDWASNNARGFVERMTAEDQSRPGDLAQWVYRVLAGSWAKGPFPEKSGLFPAFFYQLEIWDDLRNEFTAKMQAELESLVDEALIHGRGINLCSSRQENDGSSPRRNAIAQPVGTDIAFLNYEKPLKRAIAFILMSNPSVSTLGVCRQLDADGVEAPPAWQKGVASRGFEAAYRIERLKKNIETYVSKIRGNLRQHGLLPRAG